MAALAVDLQLDFWNAPEPEPAGRPVLAAVVRDQPAGGERTLEDIVLGAWEGLAARHSVDCPVCGGEMVPQTGQHGEAVGGSCGRCHTQLC